MNNIVVDKELREGQSFNFIDKDGRSTYSRPYEVVLRVDQNAWTLCWEHVKKRQKKVSYERRFIFIDSVVDVRTNRRNLHEMVITCARNYTEPHDFHFIGDQAVVFKWTRQLFQMAYSKKCYNDSSMYIVNKLLSPLRSDPNIKCKTEIVYETWHQEYDEMTKKLLKHDKNSVSYSNAEPLDTYLRFVPRPDLQVVFNHVSNGCTKISADQLAEFINRTQSDQPCITEVDALKLIQSLESKQSELSIRGFVKFMVGPHCDQYGVVIRDVDKNYYDKPLSHYYIKSSHNTYLNGTQIVLAKNLPSSKHSVCQADLEMYRQILLSGSRSVELDLWDGPNGTPVITHGPIALQRINTLPLLDVCNVIMESAFKTSSFPVVLSLENHCGSAQQEIVVRDFKNVFGQHLLVDPLYDYPLTNLQELPPPSALAYKILLKGTRRRGPKAIDSPKCSIPNPIMLLNQWQKRKDQATQLLMDVKAKRQQFREFRQNNFNTPTSPKSPRNGGVFDKMEKLLNGLSQQTSSSGDFSLNQQFSTDDELDTESVSTVEMNATLADLVNYFQSSHELVFDDPPNLMHSSSEQKIDKSINLHGNTFINHTAQHVIRVYPSAIRVDSSNFNPLNYMIAGCQMVSMNFQTPSAIMQFYDSFFLDQLNQTSGYVLKPRMLCKPPPTTGPYKAFRLEISLFSAQFLHLLTSKCRKGVGRAVVRLDLYDFPHNFVVNKWEVVATKATEDGFNTLFEANSLIFDKIVAPELAMIHLRVLDETGGKIGQRFLRVNQVQTGYRHLGLRNRYNRPEPAFLFGKFRLVEYEPENQAEIRELYVDPLRNRSKAEEARKVASAKERQLRAQKAIDGDSKFFDSFTSWGSQTTNDSSLDPNSRKSSACDFGDRSPRMSNGSLNIGDMSASGSSPSISRRPIFNFDVNNDRKVPLLPPNPRMTSGSKVSITSEEELPPTISISKF